MSACQYCTINVFQVNLSLYMCIHYMLRYNLSRGRVHYVQVYMHIGRTLLEIMVTRWAPQNGEYGNSDKDY